MKRVRYHVRNVLGTLNLQNVRLFLCDTIFKIRMQRECRGNVEERILDPMQHEQLWVRNSNFNLPVAVFLQRDEEKNKRNEDSHTLGINVSITGNEAEFLIRFL